MTDYVDIKEKISEVDIRHQQINNFFKDYKGFRVRDLYQWIWEGEFGNKKEVERLSLKNLNTYIEKIYTHEKKMQKRNEGKEVKKLKMWENLGLSGVFLKVYTFTYIETGCPLKRLVEMQNFSLLHRPDIFRFKKNWLFAKQSSIERKIISSSVFEDFERFIGFEMLPALDYYKEFLEKHPHNYVIVPTQLFTKYFPEYKQKEMSLGYSPL